MRGMCEKVERMCEKVECDAHLGGGEKVREGKMREMYENLE